MNKLKRVYLSGPMTGLPDCNRAAFHEAERIISGFGYDVINPADNDFPDDAPWSLCMRSAIARMMACDFMIMLPGWEGSKGATMEYNLASRLDIPVITFSTLIERFNDARPQDLAERA